MKNSQSGMARNWNDEGELFDDLEDDKNKPVEQELGLEDGA